VYCCGSPAVLSEYSVKHSRYCSPTANSRESERGEKQRKTVWDLKVPLRWYCLLSCHAVQSARSLPTFRCDVLQPFSGWKNKDTGFTTLSSSSSSSSLSWGWALLQKSTIVELLDNFPAFYGARRFITVFTSALHWSLSWARYLNFLSLHNQKERNQ
jgi:hypothetical protein